jgi:hypothetical protein
LAQVLLSLRQALDEDMNEDHPVFQALQARLEALREHYLAFPSEESRYRLVRHEQLIAQWAPSAEQFVG